MDFQQITYRRDQIDGRQYLLSRYTVLDGTTDNTAALRSLLTEISQSGPGVIVIDGEGIVSDTLDVWSGTTIHRPAGCGLTMAAGVDRVMFRNANPTTNPNKGDGTTRAGDLTIIDKNIAFTGDGYLRGNVTGNRWRADTGEWCALIAMHGVDGLRIEGQVLDAPSFSVQISNCVRLRGNATIQSAGTNTDGWHLNGPLYDWEVLGTISTQDDIVGINANDIGPNSDTGAPTGYGPYAGPGPIMNGCVDVTAFGQNGGRCLSTDQLINNVKIRIRGACRTQLWLFDNYTPHPTDAWPPGPGNFGDITFTSECDQTTTMTGLPGKVYVNGKFTGKLEINLSERNPTIASLPRVWFGPSAYIRNAPVTIRAKISDDTSSTFAGIVKVDGADISTIILDDPQVSRGMKLADGSAAIIASGTVDLIKTAKGILDRVAFGVTHTGGTLNAIECVGLRQVNAAGGSAINLSAGNRVRDVLLSGYSGLTPIALANGSTAPTQRGDGFATTPVYPVRMSSTLGYAADNTNLSGVYADESASAAQWAIDEGTWIVTGNKAKATGVAGGGYAHAKVDTGVTNHTLTATLSGHTTSDSRVMVRYTNQNNGVFVVITATTFQIYEGISGSFSTLSSLVTHGVATSSPFAVSVTVSGTSVSATINGHTITGTLAGNTSGTRVGVGTADTGTTFANVVATAP